MSIITGNVRVHERDHCIITGNVGTLNANHCIVTGKVISANGNHCTITGDVDALNGNHCTVTGRVRVVNGNHNRVSGGIGADNGRHNTTGGAGDYGGAATVVDGSGNCTVGVAHGDVSMSSDGRTTTVVTRGPGWTTTRSVGPGGSVVSNVVGSGGRSVAVGGSNVAFAGPGRTATGPGFAIVNNAASIGGRAVFSGGNVFVRSGVGHQVASDGGVIENIIDDAGPSQSGPRIGSQTASDGGVIRTVMSSTMEESAEFARNVAYLDRRQKAYDAAEFARNVAYLDRRQKAYDAASRAKRVTAPVPPAVDDEPSAAAGEPLCIVCADRAAKTVNKPCGHACLCVTCARCLANEPKLVCPMCRAELKRIERLYITASVADAPEPAAASSSSSSSVSLPASTPPPAAPASSATDLLPDYIFVVPTAGSAPYTIKVPRDANITVAAIKQRIHERGGPPVATQRLCHAGKPLPDDRTLAQLDIGTGVEIFLGVAAAAEAASV